MEDLRRQVLQGTPGGKTISRKAKARFAQLSSRGSSRAGSRANSRPVSRQGSDDGSADTDNEDDEEDEAEYDASDSLGLLSDLTVSVYRKTKKQLALISEKLAAGDMLDDDELDAEESDEYQIEILKGNMKNIIYNKGKDTDIRVARLRYYITTLLFRRALAHDIIIEHQSALINAFLKRVKLNRDEQESLRALHGKFHLQIFPQTLSLTVISAPHPEIYELAAKRLQSCAANMPSHQVKAATIHCLSTCTFFGGAGEEEISTIMEFLLSIIQSDGNAIGAADDADIVTAALEEWAFLATCRDDIEVDSDEAIDAFLEQLDSSDTQVQIAAGENIALAVELSFSEVEAGEDGSKALRASDGRKRIQRYQPFGKMYLVEQKVSELASISSKWVSKKDRRTLHKNFTDILNAVENPTQGPRYSNAVDDETGRVYGSRLTLQMGGDNRIQVDSWEKLQKLKALRRILAGAFLEHYKENEALSETVA
ncbi:MAG: hypothetical protein M1814_001197 [Vezdaea aestivalis]|nr:MAG: hypothetical protein M1814_001197 [Vezdaea aestivalis]